MKFRKVVLLFMIVTFGLVIEGINATRNVINDPSFEGFPRFDFDGDFPFSRISRFRGPSHDFTETESAEASGVSGLEVSNEYGDVTVRRTSDPKAAIGVSLRKEVFTSRSDAAEGLSEKVKLVVSREGGLLKISTTRDPKADYRIKTHIEIETPAPLDTRITNRHGRIVVEGARAVNVSGEFDEMKVADVTGDCNARNRHGNLEVTAATLGCRVEVEYGDAHVEKLMAPPVLEVSHGNLTGVDLAGLNATLKFADMQVRKITGALSGAGQHSDLRIDDVKGDVTLDNQGDIDIQNILGRVVIDNQRGHVRLLKAAAGVLIRNSYDAVAASEVTGLLEVVNKHGSISAHRFLKGASLETDNEDVNASDFAGPLKVEAKRGDVSVNPMRPVSSPIDIVVDIGDIRLGLPDSVNAQIDASVERGSVEGNVGALKSSEQGKRLLRATIGAGGPLLKLRSRLGDIEVSREGEVEISEPDFPNAPEIDTRFREGFPPPPPEPPAAVKAPRIPKAPADAKAPAPPEAPPARVRPTPDESL